MAIDFAGPFPSGEYLLVVTDEYSRYPEVEIVSSTSERVVLPRLDQIFARHGFPDICKTDNVPPFNSQAFAKFAEKNGFRHRKITPMWPEAKGVAERSVETIKTKQYGCQISLCASHINVIQVYLTTSWTSKTKHNIFHIRNFGG